MHIFVSAHNQTAFPFPAERLWMCTAHLFTCRTKLCAVEWIINFVCPYHSGWCLSSALKRFYQVQSEGERKAIYVCQSAGLHLGDRMWWRPRAAACILNTSMYSSALHSTYVTQNIPSGIRKKMEHVKIKCSRAENCNVVK